MTSASQIVTPPKKHLSHVDQLERLKSRGLIVSDDTNALKILRKISYYRLSGYWYPFRKTNPVGKPGRQSDFVENVSLDLIKQLYEFDRELRLLILDAVERIEVIYAPILLTILEKEMFMLTIALVSLMGLS